MSVDFEQKLISPTEVHKSLQKPWNRIPFVNLEESKMMEQFVVSGVYRGLDCELLKLKVRAVSSRRVLAAATGGSLALASVGAFSDLFPVILAVLGICSAGSLISNRMIDRLVQEQTRGVFKNE